MSYFSNASGRTRGALVAKATFTTGYDSWILINILDIMNSSLHLLYINYQENTCRAFTTNGLTDHDINSDCKYKTFNITFYECSHGCNKRPKAKLI